VAGTYESLGCLASMRGDHAAARAMPQQSFTLRQQIGDDADALVCALINMAVQAVRQEDLPAAQTALDQATPYEIRITRASIRIGVQICRSMVAFELADYAQSAALRRETLCQSIALGLPNQVLLSLEGLVAAAIELGQPAQAARLYGAASVRYEVTGIPADTLTQSDRPERIARGEEQLGAEPWATAWATGRQMDEAALLADVERLA
jgi:hypothetical protein